MIPAWCVSASKVPVATVPLQTAMPPAPDAPFQRTADRHRTEWREAWYGTVCSQGPWCEALYFNHSGKINRILFASYLTILNRPVVGESLARQERCVDEVP